VKITGRFPSQEITSRRDGSFSFSFDTDSLQGLRVRIAARKSGYASYTQEVTATPGKVLDIGKIVLVRGGAVSGWIVDQEGMPFPQARVFYKQEMERPPLANFLLWQRIGPPRPWEEDTLAGKDGSFRLKSVRPGKIRVWAGAFSMMYMNPAMITMIAPNTTGRNARTNGVSGWDAGVLGLGTDSFPPPLSFQI